MCGGVHLGEESPIGLLDPSLYHTRVSEGSGALCGPGHRQLLSGWLVESQRTTIAKECMAEACTQHLPSSSWHTGVIVDEQRTRAVPMGLHTGSQGKLSSRLLPILPTSPTSSTHILIVVWVHL